MGIKSLPGNLAEALHEFKYSKAMLDLFGPVGFENFYRIKINEWKQYSVQVHPWEWDRYISL